MHLAIHLMLIFNFAIYNDRPMATAVHAVYFWFSLTFLITRTLAVSLYASGIHDESKKTIEALRAVPPNSWSLEVRRFSEEVVNDTVALSGMRFFFLTRKLILSVSAYCIDFFACPFSYFIQMVKWFFFIGGWDHCYI